mgnify:CR=1 FL=1
MVDTNVENVASTQDQVTEIRGRRVAAVFCCSVQDYVHVTVAVDHLAPVLDVVLQPDGDIRVQLLDEKVQWFTGWLHTDHANRFQTSSESIKDL